MTGAHEPGELAAHALGLLDGPDAHAVQVHLAGCAQCRQEWDELRSTGGLLAEVPPEMFLDGPPDGDVVLQRALWQVRGEARAQRGRRRLALAAAAVVTGVALAGGAAAIGRATAPEVVAAPPAPAPAPADPDVLIVEGSTGSVTLAAELTPADGWVRIATRVTGIPPGERCEVVLVGRDGEELVAASWITGGDPTGGPVEGSGAIPVDRVAEVVVRNDAGREFVSVAV